MKKDMFSVFSKVANALQDYQMPLWSLRGSLKWVVIVETLYLDADLTMRSNSDRVAVLVLGSPMIIFVTQAGTATHSEITWHSGLQKDVTELQDNIELVQSKLSEARKRPQDRTRIRDEFKMMSSAGSTAHAKKVSCITATASRGSRIKVHQSQKGEPSQAQRQRRQVGSPEPGRVVDSTKNTPGEVTGNEGRAHTPESLPFHTSDQTKWALLEGDVFISIELDAQVFCKCRGVLRWECITDECPEAIEDQD